MARTKGSLGSSNKVTFGRRKGRKPKKSFNKHNHTCRSYRGQGR